MIHKYEFIKETNWKDEVMWYTQKDGYFQSGTLSHNEGEARKLYHEFIAKDGVKPIKEVLDSTTKELA